MSWIETEWPNHPVLGAIRVDSDRRAFVESWPLPWQRGVILGGKDTAKSIYIAAFALWSMIFWGWQIGRSVIVGIMAGSEAQAKIDLNYLTDKTDNGIAYAGRKTSQMIAKDLEKGIYLLNGAMTFVYSASYFSAHAPHPLLVIIDEAVLASKPAKGQIMAGALASVTTGGRALEASAAYWRDAIFFDHWENAEDRGYQRFGPWLKHPFDSQGNPLSRRAWLSLAAQVKESRLAQSDPNANYDTFWKCELQAGVGNIFPPRFVNAIIKDYSVEPVRDAQRALGVDTGFSSSLFGITGVEKRDEHLNVILSESYDKAGFNEMAAAVAQVYHDENYEVVMVDASNPEFIRELRARRCYVVEVPFNRELANMTTGGRFYVEKGILQIDRGFPDLIWQFKNAQWDDNGRKIKKIPPNTFDELDACLCALRWFMGNVGNAAAASE